jgi:uracil-DNA glycosylase
VARRFDRLLTDLSSVAVSARACNQYAREGAEAEANAVRRRNLRLYLEEMERHGPRVLLIGEAPSYRGGRLTGIAFTSETLMLAGVPLASGETILGSGQGYRVATPCARPSTEASATMVWATIRRLDPLPLLWNAFPFHPHDAGSPLTNRMPSAGELAAGTPFIRALLRLFPIERVVAIGNRAESSLQNMSVPHVKVRHPSQGGKTLFVEGMGRVFEE